MIIKRVMCILLMFLIATTMLVTACGPAKYTLTTSVSPDGSGTVTPAEGIYDAGTEVKLTTEPASGYRFGHWSGDATGTSNSINVTMDANKAAVYWKGRGTHKGQCWGIAPTGKQVTMAGISIIHVAGSKIVEEIGYANMMELMQELGALPPSG